MLLRVLLALFRDVSSEVALMTRIIAYTSESPRTIPLSCLARIYAHVNCTESKCPAGYTQKKQSSLRRNEAYKSVRENVLQNFCIHFMYN